MIKIFKLPSESEKKVFMWNLTFCHTKIFEFLRVQIWVNSDTFLAITEINMLATFLESILFRDLQRFRLFFRIIQSFISEIWYK